MRNAWRLFVPCKLIVLVTFLLLAHSLPAQQPPQTGDQTTRNELHVALQQARKSLIRLAAEDDSSSNESISQRVSELVDSLLYTGDREQVRYLQQHLKKVYADEIRNALEPSATLQDFAFRISKADGVTDIYRHDEELQTIVSQEIERGFLEDAANSAQRIRLPGSRSRAFTNIALAQHKSGNDSAADNAVTAAIQACFQPGTGLPLIIDPPDRQLTGLAVGLRDYAEGTRRALAEAEKAVEAQTKVTSFDWSNLAQAAIAVGDLTLAGRLMQKVEEPEQRSDLRTKIALAQARQAGSDSAVRTALKIRDPWTKATALRDIANQQSESGDSTGAITTLQLAIDAAKQDQQRTVILLHDLAWAQIDAGDRIGAERTLELALQENETHTCGFDQVDAWALLADTFAFLGHFDRAHKIAAKIDDHYFRGRALGFIAQREVEAGYTEEALDWAKQLKDADERSSTYLAIARTIIERLKDESGG